MAEKKINVEIKKATYIDGDLAPVGSTHSVAVSEARTLLATGKAVPAGEQKKTAGKAAAGKAKAAKSEA